MAEIDRLKAVEQRLKEELAEPGAITKAEIAEVLATPDPTPLPADDDATIWDNPGAWTAEDPW